MNRTLIAADPKASKRTASARTGSGRADLFPLIFPGWLRKELRKLKGAPLGVFSLYASYSYPTGYAYPSIDSLARDTGYGKRAVTQARKKLVELGLIIPCGQRRRNGGEFGAKTFQVVWGNSYPKKSGSEKT